MAVSDSAEAMRSFMDGGGWSFPVMLDADSVARAYGVNPIPTLVIIDSQGRVAQKQVGGLTAEQLADTIDKLAD